MYPSANDSAGKLVLRVSLAVLILAHGISKLFSGVERIGEGLEAAGIPGFVAYGAYIGEVVAPIMILIGYYARLGAAVLAFNMIVAILLAHADELFALTPMGSLALELQYIYLFAAIGLALMSPGRYAINDR